MRLDRTLADLLAFVDKTVGLKHTLIVLSADHGMLEMPEYVRALGVTAKRLYAEQIAETVDAFALDRFGVKKVTKFVFRPYLSLDRPSIEAAGHDPAVVEQAIAAMLTKMGGIVLAQARSALPRSDKTMLVKAIGHNHHPARSGDIYLVHAPYWFLHEKGPIGVVHGSPWRYDTFVPIIFAGSGIKSRHVHRLVNPMDIAPTLSAIVGAKPPSSSQGQPLLEVLE